MDDRELAVECLKIAKDITSPSVDDRKKAIAETAKFLYSELTMLQNATQEVKQTRRGRPPKPCAE